MKKWIVFVFISLISTCLIAQSSVSWESDVNAALKKAKAEGKLLFVEAYLPTCPACQAVEPIFRDAGVAEVYNSSFVNYKMDVTSPDGPRTFLDQRGIILPSFPQFLFFNGDGEIVHQGEVAPNAQSILSVAADANSPEKWSSNFKNRFEDGDRDLNFLVKYGSYTRLISDTTANHKVADAIFETFPKENLGSETSWVITQRVVTSTENGFFKYWIENLPEAAKISAQTGQRGQEMNTLGMIVQNTLFSTAPRGFSTEKLDKLRGYMQKIGAGQYADTYLWEYEMLAKIREGEKEEAFRIGEKMADRFSNNAPSLIYIAKVFLDSYPDLSYLPKANGWLEQAKPSLSEDAHFAEYHFQKARLELKENKTEQAKGNLLESIKFAEKAGLNITKYQDLLNSLQ